MRYIIKDEIARKRAMEGLLKADLPLSVTIAPYRHKRSLEQNDMFHGMLQVMADYTGYTIEELKELVMDELGFVYYKEVMGKVIPIRRKTSDMKTDEMTALIEMTLAWAAEKGLPTMRET